MRTAQSNFTPKTLEHRRKKPPEKRAVASLFLEEGVGKETSLKVEGKKSIKKPSHWDGLQGKEPFFWIRHKLLQGDSMPKDGFSTRFPAALPESAFPGEIEPGVLPEAAFAVPLGAGWKRPP